MSPVPRGLWWSLTALVFPLVNGLATLLTGFYGGRFAVIVAAIVLLTGEMAIADSVLHREGFASRRRVGWAAGGALLLVALSAAALVPAFLLYFGALCRGCLD